MEERHLEVARTARYCTLGQPGPSIVEAWLVCHGFGQLAARFMRRFAPLDDGSHYIIAPEALNRFYLDAGQVAHGPASPVGATWMTREDRLTEIDDYVRYLDRMHDLIHQQIDRTRTRLTALGFSQGASTVARWAARTDASIDRLVLWAGSWPPELEPAPDLFGDARLYVVAGTKDASITEAGLARVVAKLRDGGLDPDVMRYDGGHDIDEGVLRRISGAGRHTSA